MKTETKNTALMVGGTSGIGMATAERLLRRGVAVRLLGRRAEKVRDARQ